MRFALKTSGSDTDNAWPDMAPSANVLDVVASSTEKFANLGQEYGFEFYHLIDLSDRVAGKARPCTLLSNFDEPYFSQVTKLGSAADCTLYWLLERTVVPFGWQVSDVDHSYLSNHSQASAIADSEAFAFLERLGVKSAYSIPLGSAKGGRAVINYFETTGNMDKHYPGLMLETMSLFERLFGLSSSSDAQTPQLLSCLERECLNKFATGTNLEELCSEIDLSRLTVNAILRSAMRKLNARSVTEAVVLALSHKSIEL